MHYVYLLQSAVDHRRHYTGFTHNLRARLTSHNAGQNQSTVHGRPWRFVCYFAFADETKARDFEHYLKNGSGKTFAKRHFMSDFSFHIDDSIFSDRRIYSFTWTEGRQAVRP